MPRPCLLTAILILLLCGPTSGEEQVKNYCHDPAAYQQWEKLVRKHPEDMELQALHALRIGLCLKVDRGDLSVSQATDIFERMREALIDVRSEQQQRKPAL